MPPDDRIRRALMSSAKRQGIVSKSLRNVQSAAAARDAITTRLATLAHPTVVVYTMQRDWRP
jgi:hypothetical protein